MNDINKEINIPEEFINNIGYGLYGGIEQYYIMGVDGTLAQLGRHLPDSEKLQQMINYAKEKHAKEKHAKICQ